MELYLLMRLFLKMFFQTAPEQSDYMITLLNTTKGSNFCYDEYA